MILRICLSIIVGLVGLQQIGAQVSFAPAAYYGVSPSSPYCVVSADVNGDGKLDLIYASHAYAGSVTVFTNDGSGGFNLSGSYNVGAYPQYVAAADLNGDGAVDLVCANTDSGTLTVLTNDGSGNFGFNATLNVGGGPYCVVAADVNGDGKLDLITANVTDDSLTVLTNDGSGVFGFSATLQEAPGSAPDGVVAADVNGDGKLDLICANQTANTLAVFTNNGLGGFH